MSFKQWLNEHGGVKYETAIMKTYENKGYSFEKAFIDSLALAYYKNTGKELRSFNKNGAHKNVKSTDIVYSDEQIKECLLQSGVFTDFNEIDFISVPPTRRAGLVFNKNATSTVDTSLFTNPKRNAEIIADVVVNLTNGEKIYISCKYQDAKKTSGTLAFAGFGLGGKAMVANKSLALNTLFKFNDGYDYANYIVNAAQDKSISRDKVESTVTINSEALRNLMYTAIGMADENAIPYLYVMGTKTELETLNISREITDIIVEDIIKSNEGKTLSINTSFLQNTASDFSITLESKYIKKLKLRFRNKNGRMSTLEVDYQGLNVEEIKGAITKELE